MKKKTIKALKAFDKLRPAEKAVVITAGAAILPVALTLGVYKQSQKRKYKKRRR